MNCITNLRYRSKWNDIFTLYRVSPNISKYDLRCYLPDPTGTRTPLLASKNYDVEGEMDLSGFAFPVWFGYAHVLPRRHMTPNCARSFGHIVQCTMDLQENMPTRKHNKCPSVGIWELLKLKWFKWLDMFFKHLEIGTRLHSDGKNLEGPHTWL